MIKIGSWQFANRAFAAPMAGVTDRPYRRLCKTLGVEYAVTEMAASNPKLWDSVKTSRRLDHKGEPDPIAVQITGSDPAMMAEAAVFNIERGAHIIDINMGCPVKKVCNVLSGSALLKDEELVARIVEAVVNACTPHGIPVTLKTRTGWDRDSKNALRVAKRAESAGISAFTLHGRTRCDFYQGEAEYDTILEVKAALTIPVIANGDIDSPQKAKYVLDYTGADAIMVGRAAQGRPWIFREIHHYLQHGTLLAPPTYGEMKRVLLDHLEDHYDFYGEFIGVRSARKHIGWYLSDTPDAAEWLATINQIECTKQQLDAVARWFDQHNPHDFLTQTSVSADPDTVSR